LPRCIDAELALPSIRVNPGCVVIFDYATGWQINTRYLGINVIVELVALSIGKDHLADYGPPSIAAVTLQVRELFGEIA